MNLSHIANINPFRYRGYYYDTETGFYYLQTRYYDPIVCKFLNRDQYVTTGKGILSNNMFSYCLNSPINMCDSDGCDPVPSWATRINNGTATEEDYIKALSFDSSAWVGSARFKIDKAILTAQAKRCTTSNFDFVTEFALYDSDRFEDKTAWRDTFLSGSISGKSWNFSRGSIGLGSISIDGTTGGWEGDFGSLKIFNFGYVEVGLECKGGKIHVGAMASIWSPEASVNVGGCDVGIGAEIGALGLGFHKNSSGWGFKIGLGFGFSINFDW